MSNKILLIDSGATKLQGAVISNKDRLDNFKSKGINLKKESTKSLIAKLQKLPINKEIKYKSIYFYGAGIDTLENKKKLKQSFDFLSIKYKNLNAESDLIGAARCMLKKEAGIIAILGTGSNSGYYKNSKIKYQISPLGYLLGDEGSGYQIGKSIAQKYLRKQFSIPLQKKLDKQIKTIGTKDFISQIYQVEYPQREIAGFCIPAKKIINEPEIKEIIEKEFNNFTKQILLHYQNFSNKIALSGSIAYHFSEILIPILQKQGFEILKIEKNIMDGLIEYHQENG